jgi:large subunit ribosomal protein L25
MNEIDIQCLPAALPEFIEVNLEKLELGHSIHVNEVPLPQGVELISRLKKENPAIVTVQVPKAIVIEEEVAAPVTEIIGEVPAEGEEAAAAEGKEGEKGEKKEAAPEKKEAGKKE